MVAAPLTPGDLLKRSELAGFARVLSVQDGRARLFFTRLLKGRPRGHGLLHRLGWGRMATVILRSPVGQMRLGDWTDAGAYMTGKYIKTHLVWDARQEAYESVWWNAVSRDR